MKLFRSRKGADKPQDDRAAIERKLAECTAQLREADAELSRLSLAAFQSGDHAAAMVVLDKLRGLENQRDLLVAALVECERIEAQRQKAFVAQQNVTAKRSLAQHSSRFARDAGDVARAISDLKDATERLQASGASIIAVCPSHLRTPAFPVPELIGAHGLSGRIAVETYRLNRHGKPPAPGFEYEDRATGAIAPMVETLSALVARIREQFDPPPKPISGVNQPLAPDDADDRDAAVQTHSGELGHQGRLTGVAVSLRGGQQQLTELTEPFASGEQDGSEQARSAVVKAAVEAAGEVPVPDMASPHAAPYGFATPGVDFTPLFHGGNQ
jgi:hypothetical protein